MPRRRSLPKKIKVLLLSRDYLIVEGWRNALGYSTDIKLLLCSRRMNWQKVSKVHAAAEIVITDTDTLQNDDAHRWLMRIKRQHRVKLVVVVAHADELKRVRQLGVDEAILAPFRSQQLTGLIRGLSRDDKSLCMYYAERLQKLPHGIEHFDEHVDLISNIVQLVFAEILTRPQIMHTRADAMPVVYLSFENRSDHEFWNKLHTSYIIFSIHNDPDVLGAQVRGLGRHLSRQSAALGFLNNRMSPVGSAVGLQLSVYRNDGRLIVALFDRELRALLALKAAGVEPTELIEQLHRELIGAISDA